MILLTDEERKKFAQYLRQDVESDQALIKQMEKMGGPVMLPIIKKHSIEAHAKIIVAKLLEATEIGG